MSNFCILVAQATSAAWALGAGVGFQLSTTKGADVKERGTDNELKWVKKAQLGDWL